MHTALLHSKLLVITAHPDDESYVAAGTLFRNAREGGESMLVCATLGEKGTSHLKRSVLASHMKQIRKRELARATKFLGVKKLHCCGFPDGRVREHMHALFKKSLGIAKQYRPDVIMGFGKDGITGHKDHIAAGSVAQKIARACNVPFAAFTLPPILHKKANPWLRLRRKAPHYVNAIRFAKPTVRIRISAAAKKKALRCHVSQMDGTNAFTGFPKYAIHELLHYEYFVL